MRELVYYEKWNPRAKYREMLVAIINWMKEMSKQRLIPLTRRQIYYHLRKDNPDIRETEVGRCLTKARFAGYIPFSYIADDTRNVDNTHTWKDMPTLLNQSIGQYASDWYCDQSVRPEIWLEKQALRRMLLPIANKYQIPLLPCKGFPSVTAVFEGAMRFRRYPEQVPVILYLSDLNPSGKVAQRSVKHDFKKYHGLDVIFDDVALTPIQAVHYDLPRLPMNKDNSNDWYLEKYKFPYHVDLDAMNPKDLRDILVNAIVKFVNLDLDLLWRHKLEDEEERRKWSDFVHGE